MATLDLFIPTIFAAYLIYSLVFKIPSRPAIVVGLLFMLATVVGVLVRNNPLADRAGEIAFYLLMVGVLIQTVELYRANYSGVAR